MEARAQGQSFGTKGTGARTYEKGKGTRIQEQGRKSIWARANGLRHISEHTEASVRKGNGTVTMVHGQGHGGKSIGIRVEGQSYGRASRKGHI